MNENNEKIMKILRVCINNSKNPEVKEYLDKINIYSDINKYGLSLFLALAGDFSNETREYFKSLGLQDYGYSDIYQMFRIGSNYSPIDVNYKEEYQKMKETLLKRVLNEKKLNGSQTIDINDLIKSLQDQRIDLIIPKDAKRNFDKDAFVNIEYIINNKEIEEQIVSQNKNFTYPKFYNNEFYKNMRVIGDVRRRGCLELITAKQDIKINANYAHMEVMQKLYRTLYNEDKKGEEFDLSLSKNDIMIQIGDSDAVLVYIPKNITKYQYDQLKASVNELKKANPNARLHVAKVEEELKENNDFVTLLKNSHDDTDKEINANDGSTIHQKTFEGTQYVFGEKLRESVVSEQKEEEYTNKDEKVIVPTTKEMFYKKINTQGIEL